ncbi:hypothetical protein SAMN06265795_10146 [Noviherbaspirillum humi]|uniref:Lipoprotein-attachment site-containing protein n=1 Tax=Noviherbaspirillum humi TaxID=1688639 RepID=A0A239BRX1_9BURK|nr:hypothetical protein [Noviherbaspirillum humi]SNS10626.1 hypothetical protein SAMN06265795_10146 [Noviherbaspirillum humi]
MKIVEFALALGLAFTLAACDKAGTPPKPTTSSTGNTDSGSVALAPGAVPPSDATMKPTAPATGSGNAATPTQANPTPLTKEQEQSSLPHTGQVNNHSTPDTTSAK